MHGVSKHSWPAVKNMTRLFSVLARAELSINKTFVLNNLRWIMELGKKSTYTYITKKVLYCMETLDERRYTSELQNASRMWFWRKENTKDYIHEMTGETWKQMQTFNTPSRWGFSTIHLPLLQDPFYSFTWARVQEAVFGFTLCIALLDREISSFCCREALTGKNCRFQERKTALKSCCQ